MGNKSTKLNVDTRKIHVEELEYNLDKIFTDKKFNSNQIVLYADNSDTERNNNQKFESGGKCSEIR